MRTVPTAAATALTLLAACSTDTGGTDGQRAPRAGPVQRRRTRQVGLDESHDFGEGFTIAITDLRRGLDEDGCNSPTTGALSYVACFMETTNSELARAVPTRSQCAHMVTP